MSDVTLDTTGLYCPEPVFRTKIALEKMQTGQTLTVSADDPAAEDDITRWASRNGHKVIELTHNGDILTFKIKKVK